MRHVDVSPEQLEAFCRRWRVRELAVFGSVLRADFRPDSDVDLLVGFEAGASWSTFDLVVMRDELEDLFGRSVDLVEKDGLRNPFRRRATLADHQVLYAA